MSVKMAVLASGNGSNLQAMIDAIREHRLDAELRIVISDQPKAYALERAKAVKIPTALIASKEREVFEQELASQLRQSGAEWIVLAGFMRILSAAFVGAHRNRIVNIHPSLLPLFSGKDAIGQAWRAGVTETGCTVHYVDEGVDTGPIIRQTKVAIQPGDTVETLTERMHHAEHQLYVEVLQMISEGSIIR